MKPNHFSLRNAFWLITIAAFLIGWTVDRNRLQAQLRRAEIALFHAESQAHTAQQELKATKFALEQNRKLLRTALGSPK
jgi:hypothetical protein